MICHSNKCHRPRTSSCHKEQRIRYQVSTAQYFVGVLLPSTLSASNNALASFQEAAGTWVIAQLHWLQWGYLLEFQGLPVYLPLWFASLLFLGANTWVVVELMHSFRPRCSFLVLSFGQAATVLVKEAEFVVLLHMAILKLAAAFFWYELSGGFLTS